MNQIEWRSNRSKQLIAFENSKALSDFDHPDLQAKSWIQNLKIEKSTKALCVVGCGSGFQLEELGQTYPGLKVYVIESRPALIGFFSKRFKDIDFLYVEKTEDLRALENIEFLMSAAVEKKLFQPALGYQREILEEVYWFLNLRTFEALSFHLNKKIEGKSNALISMKQLIQNVDSTYSRYRLSEVLTMKEIIK